LFSSPPTNRIEYQQENYRDSSASRRCVVSLGCWPSRGVWPQGTLSPFHHGPASALTRPIRDPFNQENLTINAFTQLTSLLRQHDTFDSFYTTDFHSATRPFPTFFYDCSYFRLFFHLPTTLNARSDIRFTNKEYAQHTTVVATSNRNTPPTCRRFKTHSQHPSHHRYPLRDWHFVRSQHLRRRHLQQFMGLRSISTRSPSRRVSPS